MYSCTWESIWFKTFIQLSTQSCGYNNEQQQQQLPTTSHNRNWHINNSLLHTKMMLIDGRLFHVREKTNKTNRKLRVCSKNGHPQAIINNTIYTRNRHDLNTQLSYVHEQYSAMQVKRGYSSSYTKYYIRRTARYQ